MNGHLVRRQMVSSCSSVERRSGFSRRPASPAWCFRINRSAWSAATGNVGETKAALVSVFFAEDGKPLASPVSSTVNNPQGRR